MKVWRPVYAAAVAVAFVAALGLWQPFGDEATATKVHAPEFKVDTDWPKPLPHNWQIGQVPGIAVDKDDNVWIIHRQRSMTSDELGATGATVDTNADGVPDANDFGHARPQGSISACCLPAPAVLQFDKQGNLLRAWGGPFYAGCDPGAGCEWPASEHGIFVDHNMNVWLGGQGGRSVVKFTADGTFLLQIGRRVPPVRDSNDTSGGVNGTPLLGQPADLEVDPGPNTPSGRDELYIADGYTNLRVLVVDAETGMYLRHWGAYGQNPVNDTGNIGPYIKNQAPAPHFRNPVHAVRITRDGLVYVADRANDRIQVFDKWAVGGPCTPAGPAACGFVTEFFVATETLGPGSTWDLEVSSDKRQSCIHNADGSNNQVWTLLRETGGILDAFGRNGRMAGQFHWVHNLAADSKGDLYTAEVDTGKRVQRFKQHGPKDCKN
jgi:hypothetical protein